MALRFAMKGQIDLDGAPEAKKLAAELVELVIKAGVGHFEIRVEDTAFDDRDEEE